MEAGYVDYSIRSTDMSLSERALSFCVRCFLFVGLWVFLREGCNE